MKRVCLVSDFAPPNLGGVENHIITLAYCLMARGYQVVIATHSYEDRKGVRYLSGGVKFYYLPLVVFYNQNTIPTFLCSIPLLRSIFIREQIDIVHVHSAFSMLGHEALMLASTMSIPTVFTDHSLFGFADISSIVTNKILEFSLLSVQHVICVSQIAKNNTLLRANFDANKMTVIPNAINSKLFQPSPTHPTTPPSIVTIVVVTRLVYRKGADFLVELIPIICRQHSNVMFVIAGEGPKKALLENMVDQHNLGERVDFVGVVAHNCVRDVLLRGEIFLNVSLTEAFCMAIVEAASCGLLVVSTCVGGVPEVLPSDMIILAKPTVKDLVEQTTKAIYSLPHKIPPNVCHDRIKRMYNWHNIAKMTHNVYSHAILEGSKTLKERLKMYLNRGLLMGLVYCFIAIIVLWFTLILEFFFPKDSIDKTLTWPRQRRRQQRQQQQID